MVKAVKRSLMYLPTTNLTYSEFDCVCHQICSTINNRPLGFHKDSEEIFMPNQLITRRVYDPVLPPSSLSSVPLTALHSHLKSVVTGWFDRWQVAVRD